MSRLRRQVFQPWKCKAATGNYSFVLTATRHTDDVVFSVTGDAEIADRGNFAQIGTNGYDDPAVLKPEIAKANAKAMKMARILEEREEARIVKINPQPLHQQNEGWIGLFGDILIEDGYFIKVDPEYGLQTVNPLKTQVNGQILICYGDPEG